MNFKAKKRRVLMITFFYQHFLKINPRYKKWIGKNLLQQVDRIL
jgi:hypothetical protein